MPPAKKKQKIQYYTIVFEKYMEIVTEIDKTYYILSDKLKDMINTPEIQNMLKMINPDKLMDKLAGLTPSDSKQFSDIGSKLLNDGLNNEDDSDAVEAKANMGSSIKKIKLPWFIRKLIELGGEDLGDL